MKYDLGGGGWQIRGGVILITIPYYQRGHFLPVVVFFFGATFLRQIDGKHRINLRQP